MLEGQYFRKGMVCGGGGGGGCVTLSLEVAGAATPGELHVLPLPCSLPGHTREGEGSHLVGAVLGAPQAPGLFVPSVALLAAPPSASSQLEHSWEVSGHIAGPSFTAASLASFLTKVRP